MFYICIICLSNNEIQSSIAKCNFEDSCGLIDVCHRYKSRFEIWSQQKAGVLEATLFPHLWKQAHSEWFVFNVIKLSACS